MLSGCGGGGSDSSSGGSSSSNNSATPTTTGTLIDDKLIGVKYVNGSASGFTDANGNFPYTSGVVSFYLGDIKLGEISSIPSDKNVFIQDIVGVSRTNTSDAKVLKIASLLQSLDSDSSTDEIEIIRTDFDKFNNINITLDENTDIQTILQNENFTPITQTNAKKHLDNSLKYHDIVSDNTTPTLLSSSVTNGATNVSKDTNIVLTFSENMRKNLVNSTNIILRDLDSNVIEYDLIYNFDEITINPKVDLAYGTTYNLTIKKDITDYENNPLGTTDTIISFTTQSEIVTFQSGDIFNGFIYEIITSPITGKRWLDRNLGASRACTSSTDTLCYGDYFQWGRLADGHEKTNSTTTSTLATGITSVGSSFITSSSSPYDWTTADVDGALRTAQWSKTDGTGVCPVGFRVPTQTELASETTGYAGVDNTTTGAVKVTNSATAFSNFLKFPVAGGRNGFDGSVDGQGSWGYVCASSVNGSDSVFEYFDSGYADWSSGYRADGLSVRCVEELITE